MYYFTQSFLSLNEIVNELKQNFGTVIYVVQFFYKQNSFRTLPCVSCLTNCSCDSPFPFLTRCLTRSSADADNRLDAFSGQSRSTNMVPFHMLHIVSYCAIVTLSLSFTIFVFKKFHDLEMGVKGHSRSLRVVSFDRLCMVSY